MRQKAQANFYLILNISPQAHRQEVKAAYLKLAKIYHPDKNRGNKLAEKKFKQINEAWQVLKDPEKRKIFDETLEENKRIKQKKIFSSDVKKSKLSQSFKKKEEPIDIELPLKVSLEDICQSRSKTIHYFKTVNKKKIESVFKVQIPWNVRQKAHLRFKGEGSAGGTKAFGDLYVKILIKSHSIFQLIPDSRDLLLKLPIPFIFAVEGRKLKIPSPHGSLTIEFNPPVQPEQLLKIKNYGLPKNSKGEKGDLFVQILIDYPKEKAKEIQSQMQKMSFDQQKNYVKQFHNSSFIYPKVLKFQKKIQELKGK